MSIVLAHLFPRLEREDPEFRHELDWLAATGLRAIVWISIGANVLAYAMLFIWLDGIPRELIAGDLGGVLLLGIAAVLSYLPRVRPYARSGGLVLLFLATAGQAMAPLPAEIGFGPAQFLPVMLAITMMLGLACLPILPMQALALGASITAVGHWILFGRTRLADVALADAMPVLIMVILTAVSVALTAAVYAQRAEAYRSRRAAQESLSALQNVQSRLFVSETATSQNRFAAALCHELNSPLGTLSSCLETLVRAHERRGERPDEVERIDRIFGETAQSGQASLQRLEQVVDRMKRITNLDRAEEQPVDLTALWRDTVSLLRDELSRNAELKVDLEPVPILRGHPQKLAAVFSNMLVNASNAIERGATGVIEVRGRVRGGESVFEVVDNGRGISADRLHGLFDPAFRSDGRRVTTTNWSMFVSRGIVNEHGGYLEVDSVEGEGTTARVVFPIGS